MDAADLSVGADNTTVQATFGSNFCIWPQNCVLDDGVVAHAAIGADGKKTGKLRARGQCGTLRHTNRPLRGLHITRSPTVPDGTMNLQVWGARTDAETVPVTENNTATLATAPRQ